MSSFTPFFVVVRGLLATHLLFQLNMFDSEDAKIPTANQYITMKRQQKLVETSTEGKTAFYMISK